MNANHAKRRPLVRSTPNPLALEARIMFDAAGAPVEHVDKPFAIPAPTEAPRDARTTERTAETERVNIASVSVQTRELLFIDAGVKDWQQLAANVRAGVDVVVLESNRDGVAQMLEALNGRQGLDAIHIVSHGATGEVTLGSTVLSAGNLYLFSDALDKLGQSLTNSGDLLLYGCDVAYGEVGHNFVTSLANITRADIAASIDTTGAVFLSGNWELEQTVGHIESVQVFDKAELDSYRNTLGSLSANSLAVSMTEDQSNGALGMTFSNAGNISFVTMTISKGSGTAGSTLSFTVFGNASVSTTDSTTTSNVYKITSTSSGNGATTDIMNTINSAKYAPKANLNGTETITVADNTGGSGLSLTVTIASVNDAPSGADKAISFATNSSYTFSASDFGFTDSSDSPANTLSAVKITTVPLTGTLKVSGSTVIAGDSITAANLGNLVYTPAAGASAANGYASFTFQVMDNGGTSNSGQDTDQSPNTITVNLSAAVGNSAPTATDTSAVLSSITEGASNPSGATVSSLFGGKFSDADGNSLAGIAVTSFTRDATQGEWQYSSNGTSWTSITSSVTAASTALTFKSTDYLRFVPTASFYGAPSALSVKLIDSTSTVSTAATVDASTSGGTSVYSASNITLNTSVKPVYTLTSADSKFTALQSGTKYDPVNDTQAKSADLDLVGDSSNVLLYGAYDSSTNDMYYRVRIGNPTVSKGVPVFSAVLLLGIDTNADGKLDVYVGVDGRNNGLGVVTFAPGAGSNTSPSTSSFMTPQAVTGGTMSYVLTGADVGADGKTDAFLTFKVPFSQLAARVLALTGQTITSTSSLSFVLLTATQNNSINGDMGGIGAMTKAQSETSFIDLGLLQPINFTKPTLGNVSGTVRFTENGNALALAAAATVSDVDSPTFNGGKLVATISTNADTGDTLSLINTAGAVTTSGSNVLYNGATIGSFTFSSNTLTINFTASVTQAQVQEVARAIGFSSSSDAPSILNRTVQFVLTDAEGNASNTGAVTVLVQAVNDAPAIASTGTLASTLNRSVTNGAAYTINSATTADALILTNAASGLSITDVDAGSSTIQVTLATTDGVLELYNGTTLQSGSVTIGSVTITGSKTGSLVMTGTLANINALLQGGTTAKILYQPGVTVATSATLTLSANDLGNTGTGGALTASSTVGTITINTQPLTGVLSGSVREDTSVSGGNLSVSGTVSANITATPTFVGNSRGDATGLGAITYSNGTWTYTVSNSNATVQALTYGQSIQETFQMTTALGTSYIQVTINGVNDAPTLTATGANPTFTEAGAAKTLFSGAAATFGANESNQAITQLMLTVSGVSNGDQLIIDGKTVYIDSASTGTLTVNGYSFDVSLSGTTASITINTGEATAAALQTLVTGLQYTSVSSNPTNYGANLTRTATLTALKDNGGTSSGGNDTATLSLSSAITVTPTNSAPVLNVAPAIVYAGSSISLSNAYLGATDADNTAAQLTYTVTSLPANGAIRLNGVALAINNTFTQADVDAGLVSFLANAGVANNTANTVGLTVRDSANSSASATLNLTIRNDATVPTISVSNATVSEASPYAVFTVSLSAASAVDLVFTPTLTSGTATTGTDTGSTIEYFNGTAWVSAASGITIDHGTTSVLVRTSITNDSVYEVSEDFTVSTNGIVGGNVTNSDGATGTGSIKDDGTSTNVFLANNNTATPAVGTADNDIPTVSITSVTVSEASPYAVFGVSLDKASASMISFTPTLSSGTATVGTDTGAGLEVFNGTAWVAASGAVSIAPGSTSLLLRTSIVNDIAYEVSEAFTVSTGAITGGVANATGVTGTGTIKDDGTSTNVFLVGNNTATPTVGAANNDQGNTGTTGTVTLSNIVAGQPTTVTVTDLDLNTNGATAQTVSVQVKNNATGEIEIVTLTETGINTGIFSGTLGSTNNGTAGANNSGNLNVASGNTVTATYTDALTATGAVNQSATDTKTATAGITGTIALGNIVAGQAITISTTDADLNTDATTAQTVSVQVKNNATGETETVSLTETGINTGIFSGTLGSTNNSTAGANNSGNLNVASGNTVTATYTDALTATGAVNQSATDTKTATAGITGTIALGNIVAGQAITITTTDADLNTDATTAQTVSVQVKNNATGEIETVTLNETGINTGIFSGTLGSTNNSTAGANNSGDLNVASGNTVTATYTDALTATGAVNQSATDTKTATAGITGTVTLSNIVAGQPTTVTVTDLDLNTNGATAQTISVQVKNNATGEIETVTLTETGINTGIFSGTLGSTNNSTAGGNNSGNLNVASGNTVTATYTDALTATGAVNQSATDTKTATAGITGTIALGNIVAGQAITITTTDADLNTDATTAQTVSVQVKNNATGEIETVTLTETGINTGIFSGTLGSTNNGTAGANNSGDLNVASGNTVTVTYTDALTATGAVNQTATDTKTATAGITGTVTLSNIVAGQPTTVTVTDLDLNTNAATAQTISVQLKNNATGEIETVTLTETGINTGIFSGTLVTAESNGTGVDNTGTLNVAGGNTMTVTYTDALTTSGAVNQSTTATATVTATPVPAPPPVVVPPVVTPPVVTPPVVTPPVVTPPVVTPPVVTPPIETPPVVTQPVVVPPVVTPPVITPPVVTTSITPPAPVVVAPAPTVDVAPPVFVPPSVTEVKPVTTETVAPGGIVSTDSTQVSSANRVTNRAEPIAEVEVRRNAELSDVYTRFEGFRTVVAKADEPALVIFRGVPDQYTESGTRVSLTVPADAFAHTQPKAVVRLAATMQDGRPLPAWVQFNTQTGQFVGEVPKGTFGELRVKITARDMQGREATALFRINIGDKNLNKDGTKASGKTGLSDQLRQPGARQSDRLASFARSTPRG